MLVQSFCVLTVILSAIAIKVPVASEEIIKESVPINVEDVQSTPIYYTASQGDTSSQLVPSESYKLEELLHDVIATPATYLLPPSPDAKNEYFYEPTEPGEKNDWYPIAATHEKQAESTQDDVPPELNSNTDHIRTGKVFEHDQVITVPSRSLIPPRENAPSDFVILSPSMELELPLEEIDHTVQNPQTNIRLPIQRAPVIKPFIFKPRPKPHSMLNLHFVPPNDVPSDYKIATRLYPKKYGGEFKPIPIPLSEYAQEYGDQVPRAKPIHPMRPGLVESEALTPYEEKKAYMQEKAEYKRKLKEQNESAKLVGATDDTHKEVTTTEQETSETNFRHPGHDVYAAPLRQSPIRASKAKHGPKSNGERTEFRMHGMKGPHSYQFGYDTGKGKNRQFRFEERDNDGHVKGHYGYVDKFGKLRVVNYDADQHGFRAEAPVVTESK